MFYFYEPISRELSRNLRRENAKPAVKLSASRLTGLSSLNDHFLVSSILRDTDYDANIVDDHFPLVMKLPLCSTADTSSNVDT